VILQQIQLPRTGEKEQDLYFRARRGLGVFDSINGFIELEKGQELLFDTYFNTFSYRKWKKYTCLKNLALSLRLTGTCDVVITRLELNRTGKRVEEYIVYTERLVSGDIPTEFEIQFPPIPEKGTFAFKLYALTDVRFSGGAYITKDSPQREVNLALCICTYKREEYLRPNMAMLADKVFLNEDSALREHLFVYIADNGQTLKQEEFGTDRIKLFPNINTGGSGGFTRGMLEALADREEFNLTHVALMDDDVVFTHHTLERLYAFLRMLRPETADCMIGGAMLNLDDPVELHAAGENFHSYEIVNNKYGLRMNLAEHFLINDMDEPFNTLAWWFCCFPVTQDLKNNLSLPLFFQGDDIDFSVRNSHWPHIVLNGICVWHESFSKKRSSEKAYFWIRNMSVISSVHSPAKLFSKRSYKKHVYRLVAYRLLLYRYKEAELMLCAAADFLNGLEWLSKQDPLEINRKVAAMTYALTPVSELPFGFSWNRYAAALDFDESERRRFKRRITLNGWLLRARGDCVIPAAGLCPEHLYRVRRALHYDPETQKGYITQKSWKEAWRVLGKLIVVLWQIGRKFDKTVKRNREIYTTLITKEFWREYLKMK